MVIAYIMFVCLKLIVWFYTHHFHPNSQAHSNLSLQGLQHFHTVCFVHCLAIFIFSVSYHSNILNIERSVLLMGQTLFCIMLISNFVYIWDISVWYITLAWQPLSLLVLYDHHNIIACSCFYVIPLAVSDLLKYVRFDTDVLYS